MMIFIVFIMICSISFFFYIKKDIENESVNKVVVNTEKQTESLKQYIDIQYRYLEGVGNHISQQDLFCEDNINLIHSIKEYTKLENVGIIDKNGESHYDNGAVKNVSQREYFQEAEQLKKLPLLDVFLRLSKTRRLQYRIKPLLLFVLKIDDFVVRRKKK